MHIYKIFLYLMATLLLGCGAKTEPEKAILENIEAIQSAIENRKTGDVMDYVSDDFAGRHGINKKDLKRMLLAHYFRHKNISVVITKMTVELDPNVSFRASSKGVVIVTGAANILPESGRVYNVEAQWEQQGSDWLLIGLSWK